MNFSQILLKFYVRLSLMLRFTIPIFGFMVWTGRSWPFLTFTLGKDLVLLIMLG